MLGGCERSQSLEDQALDGAGNAVARADARAGTAGAAAPAGAATQVAARVNGRDITVHQINDRMAALSAMPAAAGRDGAPQPRQALDHLIDMTLVGQAAEASGLDREPQVLRQMQAARQEVIARAWVQQVSEAETAPGGEEVRRFYDEHPDWFAQHRVFVVQELRADVSTEQREALWSQIEPLMARPAASAVREIGRILDRQGVTWATGTGQRGSEQLPASLLASLGRLSVGQGLRVPEEGALRLWWLQAVHEQPLTWSQARPLIERQLWTQRRTERTRQEIQRLREQARIELQGEFAAPTASTVSTTRAP